VKARRHESQYAGKPYRSQVGYAVAVHQSIRHQSVDPTDSFASISPDGAAAGKAYLKHEQEDGSKLQESPTARKNACQISGMKECFHGGNSPKHRLGKMSDNDN
jgi:hypothetical protein